MELLQLPHIDTRFAHVYAADAGTRATTVRVQDTVRKPWQGFLVVVYNYHDLVVALLVQRRDIF